MLLLLPLVGCAGARGYGAFLSSARRASEAYERELRFRARLPTMKSWYPCDEKVGRFCLQYGIGRIPHSFWVGAGPPYAREQGLRVIEEFRRLAAERPRDVWVAAPLVRYLIEAGRTGEAVEAAAAFAAPDTSDVWSDLLLGFALHADVRITASERAFGDALQRAAPRPAGRGRGRVLPARAG